MPKKKRVRPPDDISEEVMFRHDRTCCVCRDKGKDVQIHHLDENPSNNDPENLAVLCFDHHNDTQIRGGFGRKLSAAAVTVNRDDWVRRVEERRDKADEIAASAMSGFSASASEIDNGEEAEWYRPNEDSFKAYVEHLPEAAAAAYRAARPLWENGGGLASIDGSNLVIETLQRLWLGLSRWYEPRHFGPSAATYIETYLDQRRDWHRALVYIDKTAIGSSFGIIAAEGTMRDAESMIVETVRAVAYLLPDFDLGEWEARWAKATVK